MRLEEFVEAYGKPYSKMLGIDLPSKRSGELTKWFLASILYSKPIQERIATSTYKAFEASGVLTVEGILAAGWNRLVTILDEGGYVRYDFSTATKLLEVFGRLKKDYQSDLWRLYNASKDSVDLEKRLKALGKGIGDTTVAIFLRDMRSTWSKADPKPTPLVKMAMERLGIKSITELAQQRGLDPIGLETALLRLAKDFLKKGRRVEVEV